MSIDSILSGSEELGGRKRYPFGFVETEFLILLKAGCCDDLILNRWNKGSRLINEIDFSFTHPKVYKGLEIVNCMIFCMFSWPTALFIPNWKAK